MEKNYQVKKSGQENQMDNEQVGVTVWDDGLMIDQGYNGFISLDNRMAKELLEILEKVVK